MLSRDEKTAPPINARLQKGYCTSKNVLDCGCSSGDFVELDNRLKLKRRILGKADRVRGVGSTLLVSLTHSFPFFTAFSL